MNDFGFGSDKLSEVVFWLKAYFCLTLALVVLSEVTILNNEPDYSYMLSTVLHMHALDIQLNNTAQLVDFDPYKCTVKRKNWIIGKFIEVECKEFNYQGQSVSYTRKFSRISSHFDSYYERTANRQGKLHILIQNRDQK